MDKQKMLLSSETAHFSLIRALHLADLITELNGIYSFLCLIPENRTSSKPRTTR
jgi:CDP-diacylglycerol--serine O-phosphatidyltransferase